MLLRAILCGRVWNGFLLGRAKKEDVPCHFCGKKKDGDRNAPFHLCCMFGNFLSFLLLWLLIRVSGHDVFFGMAGYLDLAVVVIGYLWPLLLVSWLAFSLSDIWVLIRSTSLVIGLLLIIGMLMILPWRCLIIPIFGLVVVGRVSLLLVGSRVRALGFICLCCGGCL